MILDHLENARHYYALGEDFKKAFRYLSGQDFNTIENGNYEIDGDRIFAIVNSYDTEPAGARSWEAHKKYIDVQYVVSGKENMGIARLSQMRVSKPYDPEKDFYLFEGTGDEVEVREGYFTIFFPTDVHMPNLIAGTSGFVKKVVVKVAVTEPALTLCFASNNKHKLQEIEEKISNPEILIKSLEACNIHEELPENGSTLEDNAWQKANHVYSKFGINCFADDTGLEVDALNGAPGVYSARYAGEPSSDAANVSKLLEEMKGKADRKARFRTVISLMIDATEFRFEGSIEGEIAGSPRGNNGFGYDPVFIPAGYTETFAEMSPETKNRISHRAIATGRLVKFLEENLLK